VKRHRISSDETLRHGSILLLCLAPLVISFMLRTDGIGTSFHFQSFTREIHLPCVFRSVTGYRCPACGMTRSFIYTSALNIKSALKINTAGVLLYFFCLIQIPYRILLLLNVTIPKQSLFVYFEATLLLTIGMVAGIQFISQFIS
jgi:hypothetical protein